MCPSRRFPTLNQSLCRIVDVSNTFYAFELLEIRKVAVVQVLLVLCCDEALARFIMLNVAIAEGFPASRNNPVGRIPYK